MALRPPSNQKPRDEYFSGDPAFVQPERGELDDAGWAKARLEHDKKVTRARETGDWGELAVQGAAPTKFVMRPLTGTMARMLIDKLNAGAIGNAMVNQIAFRAAIVSIENCGDIAIGRVEHPLFGLIANEATADFLDAIDKNIVSELGLVALMRASGPAPKS